MTYMEVKYGLIIPREQIGIEILRSGISSPKADISIFIIGQLAQINAFHSYERRSGYGNGALLAGLILAQRNGAKFVGGSVMQDSNFSYNVRWYDKRAIKVNELDQLEGNVDVAILACQDIVANWGDVLKF